MAEPTFGSGVSLQNQGGFVFLGITMDGAKDILGVWIGEHESSKFWLNVLNDLKSRGVLDVYLFCVDGLKGFVEAISAVYPKSQMQRCIIQLVYTAVTEDKTLEHLFRISSRDNALPARKLPNIGWPDVEIGMWFWLNSN